MFKLVFPQTCFLITAVTMSVINVSYENNLRWVSKKQVIFAKMEDSVEILCTKEYLHIRSKFLEII